MNIDDARPRAVAVRFEDSPQDRPGQLATVYTPDVDGWLEPDGPERVRVTVKGADVERGFFAGQPLRPGSFSDFVWIFDRASGAVVSASLRGTLICAYDFGLMRSEIDTPFETVMTTTAVAGFVAARHLFGQVVFPLCERAGDDCTLVPPRPYDRATGYVNAVGSIVARALGFEAETFSSLGEAVFSERALTPTATLSDAR